MSKYMNEKELRKEIYECVDFDIDSEIKYYDTIFIDFFFISVGFLKHTV